MPFFSKIYGAWSHIQMEKYKRILELLKKNKISLSGKAVDVGCGPFFFERFLEEKGISTKNFLCIDVEKHGFMDQARTNPDFILADGNQIPLKNNYASIIFCLDTIHLIENPSELHRILKPSGILVVSSFFNQENLGKIEAGIEKKLNGFKLWKKTIMKGQENELILLCKKS
jgi:ubiquinone/menaquinone biosynthesis C-methylase UbiE